MSTISLLLLVLLAASSAMASGPTELEAERQVLGALQAAQAAPQQEESYQRVYEAFTKLVANVGYNSLGNARRLVSRLNQLVGGPSSEAAGPSKQMAQSNQQRVLTSWSASQQQQQDDEAKTEQILDRLDKVNKETDQHSLRQLNDDINRLVGTLNESYLRNLRRVIERVNKTLGSSAVSQPPPALHHQQGDRLGEEPVRQPGFPGWDEFIVAVDRMQKSLANFVRSSTRLITSGRR